MPSPTAKRVIVLGGGVAGLSAAHELVERGFAVEVFERRQVPGGKARSAEGPTLGGAKALPGEHGFRFFPGFYRHLPDTMKRIPYRMNQQGVFDNLVNVDMALLTRSHAAPLPPLGRVPRSAAELELWFRELPYPAALGLDGGDTRFFLEKLWRVMTSCRERRLAEYETQSWWDFIGAADRSPGYQQLFGKALTRPLIAARAERASARTIGDIFIQLNVEPGTLGTGRHRVLNGPTHQVWIQPWVDDLVRRGVTFTTEAHLDQIEIRGREVSGVRITRDGSTSLVQADYYIAALPVERMAAQLNLQPGLVELDPALARLHQLKKHVSWMAGIQYYLDRDVLHGIGHALHVDSPWALSSISQAQFWPRFPVTAYADGRVRGILSVDIAEWDEEGLPIPGTDLRRPPARECTSEAIAAEVWAQLGASLGIGDDRLPPQFAAVHLDDDIERRDPSSPTKVNSEPLLVNDANTWTLRPEASTAIANLFLASDYVRTSTDVATMEAANEAARRAVNAILAASGSAARPCELWDLHEPELLAPLRAFDRHRFSEGKPWSNPLL